VTLPGPIAWEVMAGWLIPPSKLAKSANPPPPAPAEAATDEGHIDD